MIFIHPGSQIPDPRARILDPTTAPKEGEKFVVLPFFVAINIIKLQITFFEEIKKFFCYNTNLLPKNLSLSYQKYGFGIRGPQKKLIFGSRITEHGSRVKKAPDPGSATLILSMFPTTFSVFLLRHVTYGIQ
jgi:hypothetical protein